MTRLALTDFKFQKIPGSSFKYFSVIVRDIEICLEPCMNGCEVAFYDSEQELIFPKECTNTLNPLDGPTKALKIANKLLKKYEKTIL